MVYIVFLSSLLILLLFCYYDRGEIKKGEGYFSHRNLRAAEDWPTDSDCYGKAATSESIALAPT